MIKENTKDCLIISVDLSSYSDNRGTMTVIRHTDGETKILNVIKDIDAKDMYEKLLGIEKEKKTTDNIMKEDIDFLEIPTRIHNVLYRKGIDTIEKLCNKTYWEIYKISGMGENSLRDLIRTMEMYDLHFKE